MYAKNMVRALFVVSGLFLISLAYILQKQNQALFADVIKDFAVVLLSVVFVDLMWGIVGGDLEQARLKHKGVANVYLDPDDLGDEDDMLHLIKKTNYRIDLQGLTLSYFATNNKLMAALKESIIAGVKVRVTIMSPDNPLLENSTDFESFVHPENIVSESKTCIHIFQSFQSEIKNLKNKKGDFAFVVSKTRPISIAIRRFDDQMYLLPYVWNIHTLNSPIFLLIGEKQRLFSVYLESFENQFNYLLKS